MDTLITFNIKYLGNNIIYEYLSEYLDKDAGACGALAEYDPVKTGTTLTDGTPTDLGSVSE